MRFLPWPVSVFALAVAVVLPSALLHAEPADTEIRVIPKLAYKSGDKLTEYEKTRCHLDLYLPVTGKDWPALVWIHGGGLTGGDADAGFTAGIARRFARAGIATAVIRYRLSPHATFPAYIEDAAASFAWLHAHAAEHGIDAGRVFIGGHSAGGYLAAIVASDPRWLGAHRLPLSTIAGIIPVSGQMMTHFTIRAERGLADRHTVIADEAAPIFHVRKDTPPWLILFADKDMATRREENLYFAAVLRATGNPRVQTRQINGRDHGSVAKRIPEPGDPAAAAIIGFIAAPRAGAPD